MITNDNEFRSMEKVLLEYKRCFNHKSNMSSIILNLLYKGTIINLSGWVENIMRSYFLKINEIIINEHSIFSNICYELIDPKHSFNYDYEKGLRKQLAILLGSEKINQLEHSIPKGKLDEFKKSLKELKDIRNKLAHSGINIPPHNIKPVTAVKNPSEIKGLYKKIKLGFNLIDKRLNFYFSI